MSMENNTTVSNCFFNIFNIFKLSLQLVKGERKSIIDVNNSIPWKERKEMTPMMANGKSEQEEHINRTWNEMRGQASQSTRVRSDGQTRVLSHPLTSSLVEPCRTL